MFFDKKKYIVDIKGGQGSINTDKMRGFAVHIIIRPEDLETEWDLLILDKEGDPVMEEINRYGRFDDKSGLPLGKDKQEKLSLKFNNVSQNKPILVIFKIKEMD